MIIDTSAIVNGVWPAISVASPSETWSFVYHSSSATASTISGTISSR